MLRQIALVALFAVLPALATAQEVREIEPTWHIVTRDGVSIRCGPESVFYAVAEYNAGRMLLADGRVGNQLRVRYPSDLTAMVPVDEVEAVNDTTVRLTRASGLRSPSLLLGLSGSWKSLYDAELPAGTRLTVRETLRNDRGQIVGYRVAAPRPPVAQGHPRAFVAADAVREATPEEIERHMESRQPAEPTPTEPRVQEPAAEPEPEPETREPEPVEATEPERTEPAEPAEPETRPEPPPQPPAPVIEPSELEVLEASFADARRLPPAQLDEALEELLAEFRRTRAEADDDERLAAQLDMRIEWLQLRIATRDQRRAIEAALTSADERSRNLERQVAEWRRGRTYALVGRLVVSTVYNGERLPRMYRVQTVSPVDGATRTLGYVTPDPSIDGKLGRVVGIVGEPRFDPQLRLVIIRPDQVDVMPE
ncbi:MAG: hypothetical protein LAT64_13545 [Phycisphaerales bacterium]|nr:hypothetical protein [Planctomycetota bacterium]MCH8509778.1 hypothetical protein [Phycisphaerales bacterium]